ncbi:olfactory receptor 11L1-like [Rhinophrynus dorsalis]
MSLEYYFSGAITVVECFLLTVMSYDRYLAICIPLRYISIMSIKLCLQLVMSTWFIVNVISVIFFIPISLLQFCGNNAIDHIYCDLAPLLEVSCSDTYIIKTEGTIITIPILLCPFVFIIITYVSIFQTILKISSTTGRQKAFSTCSSHIIVVSTYYGILITKYTVPSKGRSLNLNKFISVLYTVVTPLFNPIIYSLRNQEIRTKHESREESKILTEILREDKHSSELEEHHQYVRDATTSISRSSPECFLGSRLQHFVLVNDQSIHVGIKLIEFLFVTVIFVFVPAFLDSIFDPDLATIFMAKKVKNT